MPANAATRALVATRRQNALELKAAGVDILTIGKKLAADPTINSDGVPYPQGYGIGRYIAEPRLDPPTDEELGPLVSEDIRRALRERKAAEGVAADDLRDIESYRLDRLTHIAYRAAMQGDLGAMDRVLRIMERRAKLLGLDSPTRVGVDVGDADLDRQISDLLSQLGVGQLGDEGEAEAPGAAD